MILLTGEYGAVLKFVFYLFLGRSVMIGASLFFPGLSHDIPFVSSRLVLVSSALSVRTRLDVFHCDLRWMHFLSKETKKQQN